MLKLYNKNHLTQYINTRQGETKFGECIETVKTLKDVDKNTAKYVLFGIPEDIGIRANFGKIGSRDAWFQFLESFLNIQANRYNTPSNVILLGHIDFKSALDKADAITKDDPQFSEKLHEIVVEIDEAVASLVNHIVNCGKIPVIVGGGHNNAYGNIKGVSTALKKPIGALNIDAHTDLRSTNYRHSGNGFSQAIQDNYLKKYSIFGLHKNYTPEYIFKGMDANKNIQYSFFEDLKNEDIISKFKDQLHWLNDSDFGLELDVDSLAYFPSSAQTPSGFTFDDARQFISLATKQQNCKYIHICEAKPSISFNVGKALSYLVSDALRQ